MADKKLFLLDAYALIYRAHFAFTKNPRINSKGHNTSVPFGFTNTLLEVIQKQKPTHIAVAFDTAAPTFRDEIFEAYKATRQESPEDIRAGIPIVKEIIRGFNIPILELDGYEADDIIGTIAKRAEKEGFEVYMMTPDKDFGQLVSDKVHLYKPAYMGNAVDVLGPKEVCEKWDIEEVSQVIDMLGLQGDTSDNIPGIPGIGPKTAADLLKKYKTVEGVVAHASELKGKQKERVEEFGEQAILSKKLATIVVDVDIPWNEEDLVYTGPDAEKLKPILDELEFKTMAPRIFGLLTGTSTPTSTSEPKAAQLSMFGLTEPETTRAVEKKNLDPKNVSYRELEKSEEIQTLIEKINDRKEFAFEVLITDAENFDFEATDLIISTAAQEGFIISLSKEKVMGAFKPVFEDDSIKKVGHNIKTFILALKKLDVSVKGKLFDTMLAHYLIEPEASHDLGILCGQYLDYQLTDSDNLNEAACERVDQTLQLKARLQAELERKGQWRLLHDVEMPLVTVLAAMEYEGVSIDEETLKWMSDALKTDSLKVQKEIFEIAGTNSTLHHQSNWAKFCSTK
jgi:DNA polymerase-1